MSEEHGYQRSGKKCREKFENLYKYYKKTKEGKAGRQDGKHYRFFRQLEALYGDSTNSVSIQDAHYAAANTAGSGFRFHTSLPAQANHQEPYNQSSKPSESLSLSNNSSEFDSTSSEENNELMVMDNESSEKRNSRKRRGGGGRNWKAKIKEFIDSQMRKLMEKQEAWLEKLMGNLEERERERNVREEEWRREEASRIEREHRFWAKERAWIEARDSALMEALNKLTGKEIKLESSPPHHHHNNEERSEMLSKAPAPEEDETWEELEIARLIQLRAGMESRFGGGFSEEVLWEDIAEKMGQMGYERSALMCKDKWESISTYTCNKTAKEFSKKGKENSRACVGYFRNNESTSSLYNHGGGGGYCELNEQGGHANNDASSSSPSNPNLGNAVHDPCFPFLMSEGDNLWENYGLKLNKGGQNL